MKGDTRSLDYSSYAPGAILDMMCPEERRGNFHPHRPRAGVHGTDRQCCPEGSERKKW